MERVIAMKKHLKTSTLYVVALFLCTSTVFAGITANAGMPDGSLPHEGGSFALTESMTDADMLSDAGSVTYHEAPHHI
jgi:hypothetical protein